MEDFTDTSQNVARAVGAAEVKQIYKCIDMSVRYIRSFMERQIGVELKDLLFGVDGIPTSSIPKYLNVTAPTFPGMPSSRGKQRKGVIVGGKRKKKGMQQGKSFPKKRTIQPQPGNGKQVQQAMPLAKRARTDEGWRGVGDEACMSAANHGGWDQMRGGRGGGWEGNGAAGGGGWEVTGGSSGGWGDWGGGGGGGWGAGIQQQHSGWGAWGGGVQQQHSSWGDWGGHQQQLQKQNSRSWPLQQQSNGGWEGARQQNLRGWGWGEGAHHG